VKHTAAIARVVVVQRGDSLSAIAARTHTTVAGLERLNPHVSPTGLRVGQRIRVK
jgi:LysM repeat protein